MYSSILVYMITILKTINLFKEPIVGWTGEPS